ncbi:hypothetical protein TIFTF001_016416 [Ficus carica]|uniref:Uncharacterized protein n=1 Tax=Ficus carica TaxID=3494 RepID=A0AA88ATB1_FICCA|nr:hypothetical protein TIFTF001_016416 [Ficus carica]
MLDASVGILMLARSPQIAMRSETKSMESHRNRNGGDRKLRSMRRSSSQCHRPSS